MTRTTRTRLLVLAAVGLYAVAALGTTEAVTSAERACTGWPTCSGALIPPLAWPALLAWGHRVSVLLVGVVLVAAAVAAVRDGARGRVAGALAVSVLAYGVDVGVGRVLARSPVAAGMSLRAVHLAVAVVVLAGVVAALTWTLEDGEESATDKSTPDLVDNGIDASDDAVRTGDAPASIDMPDETPSTEPTGWTAQTAAYVELTKPRLMWLLSLVALAGMVLTAGDIPPFGVVVPTLVGGALSIGASGVFNHVLERDRDAKMDRTSDRPVVTHQIPKRRAVAFGAALGTLALGTFLWFVNVPAAALDLGAIAFYSVGYTLVLKPNTSWNTTIGGAVGAFPALIGGAAMAGTVSAPALLLGLVVFTWTPAHFYNLALAYEDDYRAGGYPMLPVVKGRAKTRRHIFGYLGLTLVSTLALAAVTHIDLLFVGVTGALAAVFLWTVVQLSRERSDDAAFRAFHASNAYLGGLLAAVVLSGVI